MAFFRRPKETPEFTAEETTPDAASPIIELRDLSFSYPSASSREGRRIFHHAAFSLWPGDRIGLYGPNGSGKTTLFRLITGLSPADAGQIFFHGRELRVEKDFAVLRRSVGFLLQNAEDQLFCPTVLEDVAFGPLNLGLSPDEARQRAWETLALLGLETFTERLTHHLSGGEKKLAALAAVLAMRPEALLLDEPTNALDPDAQEHLLKVLQGSQAARVVISHDRAFLAAVSSRILTIADGRLTALDSL